MHVVFCRTTRRYPRWLQTHRWVPRMILRVHHSCHRRVTVHRIERSIKSARCFRRIGQRQCHRHQQDVQWLGRVRWRLLSCHRSWLPVTSLINSITIVIWTSSLESNAAIWILNWMICVKSTPSIIIPIHWFENHALTFNPCNTSTMPSSIDSSYRSWTDSVPLASGALEISRTTIFYLPSKLSDSTDIHSVCWTNVKNGSASMRTLVQHWWLK